jgi:hypothetical protein
MKLAWFRPWGWLYRPVSAAGWLSLAAVILFCVQAFTAVDRHSHSVSDTLYGVFPYFACSFLLLDWFAGRTGGERRGGDDHRGRGT